MLVTIALATRISPAMMPVKWPSPHPRATYSRSPPADGYRAPSLRTNSPAIPQRRRRARTTTRPRRRRPRRRRRGARRSGADHRADADERRLANRQKERCADVGVASSVVDICAAAALTQCGDEDGLDRVQPVLRLVEDDARRRLEDLAVTSRPSVIPVCPSFSARRPCWCRGTRAGSA